MVTVSDGETKDAWGYVRLSQDGRGDETIEDQKEQVRQYARRHDDLRLVTTLNDGRHTSGFDGPDERDGYATLLDKVRAEELAAIIVRDRARLARDFDLRLELLLAVRRADVEVHVVEEGGRLGVDEVMKAGMDAMKAAVDHESKMAEIERAREYVRDRVDERGHWQGGIPYGLRMDAAGEYLVADEDEIDDAIDVIEAVEDGESARAAAREAGIAHPTVSKILNRREAYRAADRGARIGNGFAIIWPDETGAAPADD